MSLASLSLGGFGEAAADDVAVLPAAMAFLGTVWGPGGLAARVAPSAFFGAEGAEGAGSAGAGANLFAVGEAGTDGECSFGCVLCCCWWWMKNDCDAVEGDWFGGSTRLEMDGEALARFIADERPGEPCGLPGL